MREVRHLEGEIALRGDEHPSIGGVAARYYDGTPGTEFRLFPGMVERIMPGAFDRAAAEDDVRALFNHDESLILGRTSAGTLRLTLDASGLRYETDPAGTTVYRDVLEHIRRGDVTGSSFQFTVEQERWTEDETRGLEVRELLAVKLYDVAPVTFPAYESTTADVRSCDAYREFKRRSCQVDIDRCRAKARLACVTTLPT